VQPTGFLPRGTDFDETSEVKEGSIVLIEEGTAGIGQLKMMTTVGPVTMGATGIVWASLTVNGVTTVSTSGLATGGPITGIGTVTVTDALVADVLTGTNTTKAVTSNSLAGLWKRGSDIASAGTIHIPNTGGGYFVVTGTTNITAIVDDSTPRTGRVFRLRFAGASP
jgi:hypothetical protein